MREKRKLLYTLLAILCVGVLTVSGVTLAKYVIEIDDVGSFSLDVVPSGEIPKSSTFKSNVANAKPTSGGNPLTRIVFDWWNPETGYTYASESVTISPNEWESDNAKKIDDNGVIKAFFYNNTSNDEATMYILSKEKITAPSDSKYLFAGTGSDTGTGTGYLTFQKIKEFVFINFHLPTEFNADYIFSGCTALETLDLRPWSQFNETTKKIYMRYAFQNCTNLTDLNLSGISFRRSGYGFVGIFNGCSSLKKLDLSHTKWGDASLTNLFGAQNLETLILTGIDTTGINSMNDMFHSKKNLTTIVGLEDFDTDNVSIMETAFTNCTMSDEYFKTFASVLENGHKITNLTGAFQGCTTLSTTSAQALINALGKTGTVTTMNSMFQGCTGITELNFSGFNAQNLTSMNSMLSGCKNLQIIDMSGIDFSSVHAYSASIFSGCGSNTSTYLNLSNTTWRGSLRSLFEGFSGLTEVNITEIDTSGVTNLQNLFYTCKLTTITGLKDLDLNGITNTNGIQGIFAECDNLKDEHFTTFAALLKNINPNLGLNLTSSFRKCEKMTQNSAQALIDALGQMGNVTAIDRMFENCIGIEGTLDFSKFNASKVTGMSSLFLGCTKLTEINMSGLNIAKVTNMSDMFNGCSALTTVWVDDTWSTEKVTSSSGMFTGCTALVGGNNTAYDANYTDKTYACIDTAETPGYFTKKPTDPAA